MATTERQNRLLVAEDWRKIYQSFQQADFKSYDFETLRRTMVAYLRENYPDDFNDFDKLFMEAINTFRTISQAEIDGQQPQKIHYIKATSNTTFDGLARHFNLKRSDVSILRVINGLYPAGEPKAGQIIKVFKR